MPSPTLFGALPDNVLAPQTMARTFPFDVEPGYYEPAKLWLFGNVRLLGTALAYVPGALGPPTHLPGDLDELERVTEQLVLQGSTLVCGVHSPAHQRTAVVPLRWGAPRVVVFSGGFCHHIGANLQEEPFRAARLWRYAWDPKTDLAVSRRAPNKLPTYARHNSTVDRLVAKLGSGERVGILSPLDSECPYI